MIAAGQGFDGRVATGRANVDRGEHLVDCRSLDREPHERTGAPSTQRRKRHVLPHGANHDQSLLLARFRHQCDAGGHALAGRGAAELGAVHLDDPRRRAVCAEQHSKGLGPSAAEKTGQAEDFTGPHLQTHVLDEAAAEPTRGQHNGGRISERCRLREQDVEFSADHLPDQRAGGLTRRWSGGDQATVAQDRDPIGDAQHLFQKVRDQDDGRAGGGQPPDQREQVVLLVFGQHGRRLVQGQHCGPAGQCAKDFDLLLLADGQTVDPGVGIDVETSGRDQSVIVLPVDARATKAPALRPARHEDVFQYRPGRHQGPFLGDQTDAVGDGLTWPTQLHLLAVELRTVPCRPARHRRES